METSYDKQNKADLRPSDKKDLNLTNASFEQNAHWNEFIYTLSNIAEATEEIDHLLHSLHVLARKSSEEFENERNPDSHFQDKIESEAEQILQRIDEKSSIETRDGLRPLMGDAIEFCLDVINEERIRLSLPEITREHLGLKQLEMFPHGDKEQLFRRIQNAHVRVQSLRSQLEDTRSYARETMLRLEIAFENQQASDSHVRDLELAMDLAKDLRYSIESKKGSALSANLLDLRCLSLLREEG